MILWGNYAETKNDKLNELLEQRTNKLLEWLNYSVIALIKVIMNTVKMMSENIRDIGKRLRIAKSKFEQAQK